MPIHISKSINVFVNNFTSSYLTKKKFEMFKKLNKYFLPLFCTFFNFLNNNIHI